MSSNLARTLPYDRRRNRGASTPGEGLSIDALWAGDSRAFLLTPGLPVFSS